MANSKNNNMVMFVLFFITLGSSVRAQLTNSTGNFTIDTAVACTIVADDIVLDCTESGGVINIVWDESLTFLGQKDSTNFDECVLQDDSCTASVVGTNMEGRLIDWCSKQVRCLVAYEQTWVPAECGVSSLTYIEVTYMCVIPDDMFPALACDLSPQLVMDCERFNQVILLVDNNDFSYFGRQDGGEDVCFKEQGSCQIPLSNNAAHFADLEACEGEGVCVVTYVQHSDGNCDGGITNYEQVIYECVNAEATQPPLVTTLAETTLPPVVTTLQETTLPPILTTIGETTLLPIVTTVQETTLAPVVTTQAQTTQEVVVTTEAVEITTEQTTLGEHETTETTEADVFTTAADMKTTEAKDTTMVNIETTKEGTTIVSTTEEDQSTAAAVKTTDGDMVTDAQEDTTTLEVTSIPDSATEMEDSVTTNAEPAQTDSEQRDTTFLPISHTSDAITERITHMDIEPTEEDGITDNGDRMYPAVACESSPELAMDCDRFQKVIALVDDEDLSYFGQHDGGEDVCYKEPDGCEIPVTSDPDHLADLQACEGEGVCVVTYVQHPDETCTGGITNYEQVIYECVDTNSAWLIVVVVIVAVFAVAVVGLAVYLIYALRKRKSASFDLMIDLSDSFYLDDQHIHSLDSDHSPRDSVNRVNNGSAINNGYTHTIPLTTY